MLSLNSTSSSLTKSSSLRRTHSSPAFLKSGKTLTHILKTISFIPTGHTEKRTCTIEHVNVHNEKDMKQILALYKKSMVGNKEGFSWDTDFEKGISNTLKAKENFKATTFAIVKDDKGDVVGFGALTASTDKFKDKDGQSIYPLEEAELCRLHIDKDKSEGCGYGAKLIKSLLEYAKTHGVQDVNLRATLTQARAINLYYNLGFKIDERFENIPPPLPHEKIGKKDITKFSHIKGVENAFVYKVPLENKVASIFNDTELAKELQTLQGDEIMREFPTLHFHGKVEDLLKAIRE